MNLSPSQIATLQGFGGVGEAQSYLFTPGSEAELLQVLDLARQTRRRVVLRGAGRSYGDASQLPESLAISMDAFDAIEPIHEDCVTVGAGATLDQLWQHVLPEGYWPPVVSGTAAPTLGGALAMNIHGKNAFRAGTLGEHVTRLRVLLPTGRLDEWTPEHPDFWRVLGSAGALAIIVEATLRLHPIASPRLNVSAHPAASWEEQFRLFEKLIPETDYCVSWVDLYGHGRGLIHAAQYHAMPEPMTLESKPASRLGGHVWRALRLFNNPFGMKFINAAKFHAGRFEPRQARVTLPEFHFLLDRLPHWQRAYGPRGFFQFQVFAPAAIAPSLFPVLNEAFLQARFVPFLAVLKCHRPSPALLDYSLDGFSLAMDLPNWLDNPDFRPFMDRVIDQVLEAGGRFYFAKDQLLRPEHARQYLGEERLAEFLEAKARLDPEGVLSSSLLERLGLTHRVS